MLLFSHFLPLFIILVGSPPGFSSFRQDPLSLYLVENNHDPRAYPLLSHTVGGQDGKLEHSLNRQLMSYKSNVFDFTRFNRLRSLLSSPKVVSVDQFGAKGDGGDATEVRLAGQGLLFGPNSLSVLCTFSKTLLYHPFRF